MSGSLHMVQAEQGSTVLGGYNGDSSCEQGNSQMQGEAPAN